LPHTAFESLVQASGENAASTFTQLDVYGQFEGRETRKEGPGCTTQIITVGTPSLHLSVKEISPRYEVISAQDVTTDASAGITVEAIREASGRIVGVSYINTARQEQLNIVCHVEYQTGNGSSVNVPGTADGKINGVAFNNAPVNCNSIGYVTNLPR
jgi:hypothetical protein